MNYNLVILTLHTSAIYQHPKKIVPHEINDSPYYLLDLLFIHTII